MFFGSGGSITFPDFKLKQKSFDQCLVSNLYIMLQKIFELFFLAILFILTYTCDQARENRCYLNIVQFLTFNNFYTHKYRFHHCTRYLCCALKLREFKYKVKK